MNSTQAHTRLLSSLQSRPQEAVLNGLRGTSARWLIGRLLASLSTPLLWITQDLKTAEQTAADLSFFSQGPILLYPCGDALPWTPILPSPETVARRLSTLYTLATSSEPAIIVAPVQALCEATLPAGVLCAHVEYLERGETADREALLQWLSVTGYQAVSVVQAQGEFSLRGGLVDIFPPGTDRPVRIDFFGDSVEEIRLFDPFSQRSEDALDDIVLLPAREGVLSEEAAEAVQDRLVRMSAKYDWPAQRIHETLQQVEARRLVEGQGALLPAFYPEPAFLTDYLPASAPVVMDQPEAVERALKGFWERASEGYGTALEDHRVLSPMAALLKAPDGILEGLADRTRWLLEDIAVLGAAPYTPIPSATEDVAILELHAARPSLPVPAGPSRRGEDLLGPVMERLRGWLDEGYRIVLAVQGEHQGRRITELLHHHEVLVDGYAPPLLPPPFAADPEAPGVYLYQGVLSGGFALPEERLAVLTEEELLGIQPQRRRTSRRRKTTLSDLAFEDLKPGNPVVHRDHGIGLYQGLVRMEAMGVPGEYLLLEYRGGDKLYVPVDRLGLIQKYIGMEDKEPKLDKLGASAWQLTKQKVKKSIYEIAHELVDLYASRKVREGFAFTPPDAMFRQFEAAFPFEETPDQIASIEEILADMESQKPMDRLLCGDVGYGKTEVAMRGIFKAVEDGKQVAVLVPTTLLAEQHERTFRRRFQRFPISVDVLSRLRNRKEQKEALERVRTGRTDILVGTHRILQGDVVFKDLGLLVVDEEHRFGVKHKEQLKKFRQTVDCLTLTATPIPRTLQLSLLNVRDLSVINTAPRDRLPVKTYLAEFDDTLIKEAVKRELERGGQIFFVHNRVKSIYRMAEHVQQLVPEARVAVAHGQMEPRELEEVILRFVRGEIDCLACTTIIESGIDIPSANTMIINRADKLGLADLYQLRGRVGRASEQAYAYLFIPHVSELGEESRQRLTAIMELGEGGGGFRLAMQDLKIRGAGNILGTSQSGQIVAVGYELYLDLLQHAVEELKGLPPEDEIDPEVHLGVAAFIPDDYVPDVEQRLLLYRRMARVEDKEAEQDLADEIRDRFGPLPLEVETLIEVMEIKRILKGLRVIRMDLTQAGQEERLVLTFGPAGPPDAGTLLDYVQGQKGWRFFPDGRLMITLKGGEKGKDLSKIKQTLQTLAKRATKS